MAISQKQITEALMTLGIVLVGLYVIVHYTDQSMCSNFGLTSQKVA